MDWDNLNRGQYSFPGVSARTEESVTEESVTEESVTEESVRIDNAMLDHENGVILDCIFAVEYLFGRQKPANRERARDEIENSPSRPRY